MAKNQSLRLSVALFISLCISIVSAGSYIYPATRDPVKWPFDAQSHWNMPIHKNAVYVNPNLPVMNVEVDEDILLIDTTAPLVMIKYNGVGWGTGSRCPVQGGDVHEAHIPANFVYAPKGETGGNAHEYKPNAGCAALLSGGVIKQSQPFTRCSGMTPTSAYNKPTVTLTGMGHGGAHGGSRMSSIGGTIRFGELVPGGEIRHVMKCNINNDYLFYDGDTKGYRWPALQADGYASSQYSGSFKPLRMGSLMALPASVDLATVGFETEAAKILARAFQDFGAYVVDDPYRNSFCIETEISPFGRVTEEFQQRWGFPMHNSSNAAWKRDIDRIVTRLHVVDNNTSTTVGGGPNDDWANRRAPKAPPFGAGGDIPNNPAPLTKIQEPAALTNLEVGKEYVFKAEGENLKWSYDADSDGKGDVIMGTGSNLTFKIPADITGPMTMKVTVIGNNGVDSREYTVSNGSTSIAHPGSKSVISGNQSSVSSNHYSINGRILPNGSADKIGQSGTRSMNTGLRLIKTEHEKAK